jgi:hypothetical protein
MVFGDEPSPELVGCPHDRIDFASQINLDAA